MYNPQQRPSFIYDKKIRKKMAELIDLCEKSLSDDKLETSELAEIVFFIEKNAESIHAEPFYKLVQDLVDVMNSSDIISENELNKAKNIIIEYIKNKPKSLYDEVVKTNDSFFDNPVPDVVFKDKIFVLTGIFTIGERSKVAKIILERGGKTAKQVINNVDYLVVGEIASSAYKNGNYGTKIQNAIQLKRCGADIAIISEQHFIKFINNNNIVRDVENLTLEKDVITCDLTPFRQKDISKEDRTFYGVTLSQDNFRFRIPFEIIYNHSNLGVISVNIDDCYYENGIYIADSKRYNPKRIVKAVDKRNGNEVKNSELLEYIFKNLDENTLIELYAIGILKNIPSGKNLYIAGYKTLDEIAKASDKELLAVKGIGKLKLAAIREFLEKQK